MRWATHYIEKLRNSELVSFRPRGRLMNGKIEFGQLYTIEPLGDMETSKGQYRLV